MKRLSLRALLYWLAPAAGAGALAAQTREPAGGTAITVDTIVGFRSRYLDHAPAVRVFLPAGYVGGAARYPLLLANDGQDMEAVGLVPALDSLAAGGVIDPPIVVAVHAGDGRLQNYGTAGQPNAQGLGAGAADYERFLVRELLPLIERRYRVRAGGAAIMGWSLGGLSAFDLAWRNSSRFQRVGVFSGSFWWRTDDASVESRQSSRIVHRRVRNTAALPRLEIWLEAGLQDETADRDNNGVIDAIQDTRELIEILVGRGMKEGRELQYLELDGGHDLETWSQALPRFLAWAFPAGVRAPSHTTHRPAP